MNEKINIEEQKTIKKSKKIYLSLIFWVAITILAYISYQYFLSEFDYKQNKAKTLPNSSNQLSSNQAKTDKIDLTPPNKIENQESFENVANQKEALAKQQMQIIQLQNDYQNLKTDLQRLKSGQNLPKIILTFVNLGDLISLGQNYEQTLNNLELLSRIDPIMSEKVSRLKLTLKNPPKNNSELVKEFVNLIPLINAKKIEIENAQSFFGKIKLIIAKFVTIKRTGENRSDFEAKINDIQKYIENGQYNLALKNLQNLDLDYQQTLLEIESDLQSAYNFWQIHNEIYAYLNMLSNY